VSSDRCAEVKDACERAGAALLRGEVPIALRHYEYAQRLAPGDAEITLAVGAARLRQQDPRSTEAFSLVATRDDVQEAWLGLAAAHHGLGQHDLATRDLRALLSRHGHARGTGIFVCMTRSRWRMATPAGALCRQTAGCVTLLDPAANMNRAVILLDGVPLGVRPRRCARDGERLRALFLLPGGWRHAAQITVCLKGCHLLGSPLDASAIGQVEGFVTAAAGGLTGWAWFPRDPDCTPVLAIQDARGATLRVTVGDPAPEIRHARPLARPRRLSVPGRLTHPLTAPISVQDEAGRNLYGSPLEPLLEQRSAAGAAELARRLFPAATRRITGVVDLRLPAVPADIVGVRSVAGHAARPTGVDVVIPAYRGRDRTLACIDSVLTSLPTAARCIVVEDASPEAELVEALQELAGQGRILLRRQAKNRGFPATANAGIRAAGDRDVILLNSDTLTPPGWIERLAEAAYSAADIGTATPLSNNATVFSYPRKMVPIGS
jgi:hypothetical protein